MKKSARKTTDAKKILRPATGRDLDIMKQNKSRARGRDPQPRVARQLKLEMKISQVEMQADGRKATFFYSRWQGRLS